MKKSKKELNLTSHEPLYKALIYSANEAPDKSIARAYEILKHTWFFLNSDKATFNGNEVEKDKRPLLVNPNIVGTPDFKPFFAGRIGYCQTKGKITLLEEDFIASIVEWIQKKLEAKNISLVHKRKYREFQEYLAKKVQSKKGKTGKNNFTQKEICMAYAAMNTQITDSNYRKILATYSNSKSDKILQKRYHRGLNEVKITTNRSSDTKTLQSLEKAKKIVEMEMKGDPSGRNAIKRIEDAITRITKEIEAYY